ncbi:hypothetical protein ACLK19_05975 [Escherichia coli]
MLPAHGYQELRKFKHLVGDSGSIAESASEVARFPGPVVVITSELHDRPNRRRL